MRYFVLVVLALCSCRPAPTPATAPAPLPHPASQQATPAAGMTQRARTPARQAIVPTSQSRTRPAPGLTITRRSDESLTSLATRVMPKEGEFALMHRPVEGTFGPGAGNVVVLWGAEGSCEGGAVLVPVADTPSTYRVNVLPSFQEIGTSAATPSFQPVSVLFDDVNGDGRAELLIILRVTGRGAYEGREGDSPVGHRAEVDEHVTGVFGWNGQEFTIITDVDLSGPRDAAGVRKLLRARRGGKR